MIFQCDERNYSKRDTLIYGYRDVIARLTTDSYFMTCESNGGFFEYVLYDKESKKECMFSEPLYLDDIATREIMEEDMKAIFIEMVELTN